MGAIELEREDVELLERLVVVGVRPRAAQFASNRPPRADRRASPRHLVAMPNRRPLSVPLPLRPDDLLDLPLQQLAQHAEADLISRVTNGVMDDFSAWQQRPLEDVYPVVFLDCLVGRARTLASVGKTRSASG